jgi:uncharacterized spore protein YtfJ
MAENGTVIETIVARIKEFLDERSVAGDPIVIGDVTIVPIVSIGFGFGGGTGAGGTAKTSDQTGSGGGAGGGGGIRPVALVIVDANGARVELLREKASSIVESISDTVARVVEKGKDESSSQE